MISSVVSRRFVGREAELRQMHAWRLGASRGRASLILIGGEAGMGKSRLLWEFTRSLTGGRAPLLAQGECLERAPRPLGPFREIVKAITLAAPWHVAKLGPLGSRALDHLAPNPNADLDSDIARLEKADLFAGVLRLFESASKKRATIVTIEDLHWADTASLELLEYLAPRIGTMRLTIVATLRDDVLPDGSPLAATLGRLERESCVHTIALRPLRPAALRQLLESALEERSAISDESLQDIEMRSDGNPLWAEELLKNYLDQGSTHKPLPRSIHALIGERILQLTSRERRVLLHAAVLGQRFDVTVLAHILACSLDALTLPLQHARDVNLVVEEPDVRPVFRFRHALTRQALYESQLALSLRPLHARIARALEALHDADDRLDELAYHWWQAVHHERARFYNERAGAAALELCAYADAAVYFERTLVLCAEPLERARLMSVLGTAYRSDGNAGKAVRWCLESAMTFASAGAPAEAVAPLLLGCAELSNANRNDEARDELERFLARDGARVPSARGRLRCHLLLSESLRIDVVARTIGKECLEEEVGALENAALLRYWTARLMTHARHGELGAWRRAAVEARVVLGDAADAPLLERASTHQFIGLTALQLAQHDEARDAFGASRALVDSHALRPGRAYLEALRATDAFLSGRLHEAREAASFAAENARFTTTRSLLGFAGPLVGLALNDNALIDVTVFEAAAPSVLAHGLRWWSDLACGSVAAVWLASGRQPEARELLEACIASMAGCVQGQFLWPLAARHVGMPALLRLGELLNLERANPEHHVAHAVAAHVDAIAAERSGNPDLRKLAAADAAERYRKLGWPLFEAQALELLERMGEARAIYERCGSVADVRRLALGVHAPAGGATGRPPDALSPREREVAAFVTKGWSNRAVADRLGLREKTIQSHLTSIYGKLSLRSRAELIAQYNASGVKPKSPGSLRAT